MCVCYCDDWIAERVPCQYSRSFLPHEKNFNSPPQDNSTVGHDDANLDVSKLTGRNSIRSAATTIQEETVAKRLVCL